MLALFNIYDYIFFAFILFFALIGLVRGGWVQLFAAAIWLAALAFYCVNTSNFEHGFLSAYMSPDIAHWFLLAATLMGACILNFIIRLLLNSLFKANPFTFFNKLGGFVFGAFASGFIVVLMIYALNASMFSAESTDWEKSFTVKGLAPFLDKFKAQNENKTKFESTDKSDANDGRNKSIS